MPRVPLPRDSENDYTRAAAERRRAFLSERTGASLEHVGSFSFDPEEASGNVEQFAGVAQVPIGVAGPLLVNGEEAQGEFYVPLATAKGSARTTSWGETGPRSSESLGSPRASRAASPPAARARSRARGGARRAGTARRAS
jgi:hypothetical protein